MLSATLSIPAAPRPHHPHPPAFANLNMATLITNWFGHSARARALLCGVLRPLNATPLNRALAWLRLVSQGRARFSLYTIRASLPLSPRVDDSWRRERRASQRAVSPSRPTWMRSVALHMVFRRTNLGGLRLSPSARGARRCAMAADCCITHRPLSEADRALARASSRRRRRTRCCPRAALYDAGESGGG